MLQREVRNYFKGLFLLHLSHRTQKTKLGVDSKTDFGDFHLRNMSLALSRAPSRRTIWSYKQCVRYGALLVAEASDSSISVRWVCKLLRCWSCLLVARVLRGSRQLAASESRKQLISCSGSLLCTAHKIRTLHANHIFIQDLKFYIQVLQLSCICTLPRSYDTKRMYSVQACSKEGELIFLACLSWINARGSKSMCSTAPWNKRQW